MPEDLYDTIPIEAIVPNQESTLMRTMHPMPIEAPLEADEDLQTRRLPSLPLPGGSSQQPGHVHCRTIFLLLTCPLQSL